MGQLSKLTTDVDGTFEVGGISYGYVDTDGIRNIYEMTTKAKMIAPKLRNIGTRIENIMPFFEKQSRIDRVNNYIDNGIEDTRWLSDRDFLL